MAYETTGHVTLGQLQTALERTKTEYEAKISSIDTGSSESVATDAEVTEMLDTVFGSSETE